jgi:hypothetical protein
VWLDLFWLSVSFAWNLNAKIAVEKSPTQTVRIRFVDSATGYAVKPDSVEATALDSGRAKAVARPPQWGQTRWPDHADA